jgi:cytochrome c553
MDGEKNLILNRVDKTVDGTSGFGTNPIHPHTVSKAPRTCMDCHGTTKAVGLGGGYYNIKANFPEGAPIDFELERIVDEEGHQIQQTAHEGARPFNKEELEKIQRAGTCVACHGSDAKFWKKVTKKAKVKAAPTDALHQEAIGKLLKKVK